VEPVVSQGVLDMLTRNANSQSFTGGRMKKGREALEIDEMNNHSVNPFAFGIAKNLRDLSRFLKLKRTFGRFFLRLAFAGIDILFVTEHTYVWRAFLSRFFDS
jgi:hypothetical protein